MSLQHPSLRHLNISEALMNALASERENLAALAQLPDVPPIASLHDMPPPESAHRVIGTAKTRLRIYANSDNSGNETWVDDTPNPSPSFDQFKTGGVLVKYWDGGPAA